MMTHSFQTILNKAIQESNQGNQELAINLLLKCLKMKVDDNWVCLNLANCYLKLNKDQKAAKYFKKILKNNPKDVKILLNLNQLALRVYRFDLALKACEIAETLAPNSPDVLAALIEAKKEARKNSGVKSLCKRMIALLPNHFWAYNQLANHYLAKGKFKKAEKFYEKALALDPNSSFIYANLVKSKRFSEIPKVLISQLDTALANNQEAESKARLYLAKAKIFNDCQEFQQAWEFAEKAKQIKAALAPFNPANFESYIQKLIQLYSNPTESSQSQSQPVCIVGMPRSGTTLIEQILSTHSEFYAGGETPALDNAIFQQLKGASYFEPKQPLSSQKLNFMADEYEAFFKRFHNFSGNRIIDKVPMHFMHIGYYLQIFPKAKIINFERDKYDVSTSILFENFNIRQNYTHKISDMFNVYDGYKKIMTFWQKIYPDSVLTVKYKDFIKNHSQCKQQILDFVGVTTASNVDYKSSKNSIETPSVWQARQPIYKSSIDRWKRYPQMLEVVKHE